ncbi:MAG: ornithine carbamoyltransferase [Methyloligella sp.]|nr:MAG: ornithine carbamoyltransferase [Methyloligella sp.]
MAYRHFIDLDSLSSETISHILSSALAMKTEFKELRHKAPKLCEGQVLASIFEKPSTRTRLSFDVAMRDLGGSCITLSSNDLQLGRGESIADTARVMSRYVDAIMLRTDAHQKLLDLAEFADVPVINGLTDHSHPCQIMADILTFVEKRGSIEGAKVAWIGDCNNVALSAVHAATKLGFSLYIAAPKEYGPTKAMEEAVKADQKAKKNSIHFVEKLDDAFVDADLIMTDTWVSMGDEDEEVRKKVFAPYQVNSEMMKLASKDALFMHCLPAYRGREVTAEVLDGPQSVVFDEAENRLHAQKAIVAWSLGAI